MTETCQICIKMKSFYRRVNTAVHRNNGGCYNPYYLYLHHLSCHHSLPGRPRLITYIQISNRTATNEETFIILCVHSNIPMLTIYHVTELLVPQCHWHLLMFHASIIVRFKRQHDNDGTTINPD